MSDDQGEQRDWLAHPREMEGPIYAAIGMSIVDGGEGWARVDLELRPELMNADGVLHGGMWAVVADTAMGNAIRTVITREERVATVQSDYRWLRPLGGSRLSCLGRVERRGRTVWHCSCVLEDDQGRTVGTGTGTFVVFRRDRDGEGARDGEAQR